ncbi:MAG: hypothetical protein WA936_13595 [Erythrobacter sp.]
MPGVAKCGTTSLHDILVEHPRITGGRLKEIRFLMDAHDPLAPRGSVERSGLRGWASHFRDRGQGDFDYWIDASPQYQYQDIAPRIVGQLGPEVRLLFIVRAPSKRLASLYRYGRYDMKAIQGFDRFEDFIEAIRTDDDPRLMGRRMLRNGWRNTRYDLMLEQWRAVVDPTRIYCLWLESLRDNREGELLKLAQWLGIDAEPLLAAEVTRANQTRMTRSRALLKVGRLLGGSFPDYPIVRAAKRAVNRLNSRDLPIEMTENNRDTLDAIEKEFASNVERFNAMVSAVQPGFDARSFG